MGLDGGRVRVALAMAVASALGGCDSGVIEIPGLPELCDGSLLPHLTPGEPVDYLAIRVSSDMMENQETDTWGTACSTATDGTACEEALEAAWPTSSGWGYCGEGCSDSGLVYTRGDEVGVADSPAEVVAFLTPIDAPADALFVAIAHDYTPVCTSLVGREDGSYELEANFLTSDCPWTTEDRLLSVQADGTLTVLDTIRVNEDGACAGRRPHGLRAARDPGGDAVARQVAHLAHLEAAAVVAFERLAVDLERLGAPGDLIRRARRAARDEVRHARRMTAVARAFGAVPAPVVVEPHRERPLLAVARENAVEGCVRETFGVADAMIRAQTAPTPALRALFAGIARDESRHAELSWDIAAWADAALADHERALVRDEMAAAWEELVDQLGTARPDAVERSLGAPSADQAVAMAHALREHLAA